MPKIETSRDWHELDYFTGGIAFLSLPLDIALQLSRHGAVGLNVAWRRFYLDLYGSPTLVELCIYWGDGGHWCWDSARATDTL